MEIHMVTFFEMPNIMKSNVFMSLWIMSNSVFQDDTKVKSIYVHHSFSLMNVYKGSTIIKKIKHIAIVS